MEQKKYGHGGARQGAGRKKKERKKPIGIRLPTDLYEFLKMQKNKSVFFEEVLRYYIAQKGINL